MNVPNISRIHLPALDGVRGLAILMVLAAHHSTVLDQSVPFERGTTTLCSLGTTGVDLFFVLSGFLITGILLDTRSSSTYFRTFYARRTVRIFPLYYLFLFILFFPIRGMHVSLQKVDPFATINPLWYLLYVSNLSPSRGVFDFGLSHMWSLAVEEQFYLIWPMVLFLVPRRFVVSLCLAGIGGATALRLGLAIRGTWSETLHRLTSARVDTLLLGALAAVAIRDDRLKAVGSRLIRPVAIVSGLVYAATVAVMWAYEPLAAVYYTFGYSAIAAFYACLVFWSATSGSDNPVFNGKLLRVLGKYSYGIYVLHALLLGQIKDGMRHDTLGDRLLIIAVNLATTAGLVYISWVALEAPVLSLKRHFPYAPAKPRSPVADPELVGQPG